MGQSAAETVDEIERARDSLEGKVRELEHRMPAPAVWAKRVAGVAVGGGLGGTAFWFAVRRLRTRRRGTDAAGRRDATVVELALPELPALDGTARKWLFGAGAVWLALRFAEVRAARRTNRLLAAGA